MSFHNYEPVIGLEIHAQLKTKSKIFCSDSTNFDASDNENISPVSAGMPGTLPVLNLEALNYSIKIGLALNCTIDMSSVFSRKNYFYPDLPKGYQISQYDKPICHSGYIEFLSEDKIKKINISRAHMEEDAGKSTHLGDVTLINLNRAGIPLLEIVTAPEIESAKQAADYARAIRQLLRYLDVCDGNLEEGSLRCDCNISVRKKGEKKLGTRVEIKNINSFRFVEKALDYEIQRQIDCIERAEKLVQETRLWDPDKNRTFTMRTKEDAQDYRYFPDPDLPKVKVSAKMLEQIRKELPELPIKKVLRFQSDYKLSDYDSNLICQDLDFANYFEDVAKTSNNPRASANWIISELMRELNNHNLDIKRSHVSAKALAELIQLVDQGKISGKIAKSVFVDMWSSKKTAKEIVEEKQLSQITDPSALEKVIQEILDKNQDSVQQFKNGKIKLLGFFVGLAMKATKGQASPEIVNDILNKKLNE